MFQQRVFQPEELDHGSMWPELGMWRDETTVETGLGRAGPANPADYKELATRLGCYSHTRQAREQWLEVPCWTWPCVPCLPVDNTYPVGDEEPEAREAG